MLPLTIWMNMPTFYQGDFFRALVASGEVDLQVIFAHQLSHDRIQLGWEPDVQGFSYQFLPLHRGVLRAMQLASQQRQRLHVVNGIWAEPAFAAALAMLVSAHSRFAIYTEAPAPGVSRSALKQGARATFGRLVCRRAAGAFPVSHFGADFLTGLGLSTTKLYPFGYFRAAPVNAVTLTISSERPELIFVGQLIPRKGVDLLLMACATLMKDHPDMRLTLIGVGEQADMLQALACDLGLGEKVHFAGMTPAREVMQRLQSATALVLPSRWDGWGVVVNEALSMGVPVIVSDRCGAADLIKDGYNGYIFHSEDAADLTARLRQLLEHSNPTVMRSQAWAASKAVAVESIVPYFIDCLKHMSGLLKVRPVPPWQLALPVDRI